MSGALAIDTYQITTLVSHFDEGRHLDPVTMAFFFRGLPERRNFVVFSGLWQLIEHAAALRFDAADLETLAGHPLVGPALRERPALLRLLGALDGFRGEIDAVPEGTPVFAGPGRRPGGEPFVVAGAPVTLYTPLVQVTTDLLSAKLIETPWLSRINHASMVASKAARVVLAAAGKPVYEFGQRRTHADAAVDAAWAAWIAGCAGSSNLRALQRFGIPAVGTMDHFAVQATERPGVPLADSERAAFAALHRAFPRASVLLVDTYDTPRGIRHAVEATGGRLAGIRLDSSVTPEAVRQARTLLDELGAREARILVSDRLDELRVAELLAAGADAFGVGENITCSPDHATGIGAVAKIVVNGAGKITMKLSRGSGKATLPGRLQVYRLSDHDLVATAEEAPPAGGRPLLAPLWRGRGPVEPGVPAAAWGEAARARLRSELGRLPAHLGGLATDHGRPWPIVVSDALAARIEACVKEVLA